MPHTLLEDILQSELPSDIFAANVSGNDTSPNLADSIHNLLEIQLEVRISMNTNFDFKTVIKHLFSLSFSPPSLIFTQISRSSISNLRITTVAKYMRPLVQVCC